MGTFQPNRRRTQTPLTQPATQTRSTENPSQPSKPSKSKPTIFPTALPIPVPSAVPRPILRSTPLPSPKSPYTSFPNISRHPHRVKAIHEFDKLVNFLLEHRPQVAQLFIKDCWELYNEKHKKKKNVPTPTPPTSTSPQPPPNDSFPATSKPLNETPHSAQQPNAETPTETVTAAIPETSTDHPLLQPPTETNSNVNTSDPPPLCKVSNQQVPPPIKTTYNSKIPYFARQSRLENLVYERWRSFVSEQGNASEHLPHDDQQYVVCHSSESHESPIALDAKSCCMALMDAKSKLSEVHLKALRFLWFNLIENTCTGAVFNHGIGYPRTHIIFLFAKLVIASPDRAKNRILIICPPSSLSQWEMSSDAFDSIIPIHFLTMSHWQENINQWRARGGVLIATDQTYYNVLTLPATPDKRAALAALCFPGPDICILDEASRTNIKPEMPRFRRLLNRTRTKSRLALTSLPLAGFISRAWSIADWACPRLFGTSIEYQWRYVDPIVRGHTRKATLDDAKAAFNKACFLYNKIGMVTFTVDSSMRREALLSKGLRLHESVIWVNLSREEYAIYRDVEIFLNNATSNEHLSPFIATDLLVCAASSVHALRRTLQTWTEAKPDYLDSIGHRNTFSRHQESLHGLLRTVEGRLQEGLICTKMQLALLIGRQCLLKSERLVIFASSQELFEDVHRFLCSRFDEAKVDMYDSASSIQPNSKSLHHFNTAQDGAILVAPYGPTLHCMEESGWGFVNATRVLFIDSSWHSGACVQAVNRVHNFAQLNRKAHVHHLLATGTVELALSSILEWRYKHVSSCDSSTLPANMSSDLDDRGFLLAPEVSPFWIRGDPPVDLPRSGTLITKQSEQEERTNPSDSNEHDELILPLQTIEDTTNGDKCVHEIVLNSDRYISLSENLDLWMRLEWTRKTRYLREPNPELECTMKSLRDSLYKLGGDMVHEAKRCGDTGGWLAQDNIFMEDNLCVCHLLSSWDPYRRLYERSVEIADLPPLNQSRGEKRQRLCEEEIDSCPKSQRYCEA